MTMAGMNCTAWNSVVANALLSRPRAMPSTAPRIAVAATSQGLPGVYRPSSP